MNVQERLSDHIHSFIDLKRLYAVHLSCLEICAGKEIKNDLLYFQVLFTSIDGLVLRLCNFTVETYKLFDQIKSNKPKEFSANQIKKHLKSVELKDDNWLFSFSKKNLEEVYYKRFSNVISESREFPNENDFEKIKKELEAVFAPIKNHRDTVVAHKDKNGQPASTKDVQNALDYIQELLGDLYFIHSFGSYSFDLGGFAADPKDTAMEFTELILKNRYEREQDVLKSRGVL